jgi:DNA uptake protein ComE-like DNA-binding protein
MAPLKTLAALFVAIVVAGLFPVLNHAAQKTEQLAADRIIRPTKIKPLDINSASIDELKALPEIDDAYAQRIVEGRPYQKKDELISRKLIPVATYIKIKDRVITVGVSGS